MIATAVPLLTKAQFPAKKIAAGKPRFLVFWNGPGQQKRGAKTQVQDHTKRGGKGQKKRGQSHVFLTHFQAEFRAFLSP
jgi:hypothetical protein